MTTVDTLDPPLTNVRGHSLRILIDEVEAMHDRVADRVRADGAGELSVYRWRPEGQIETPALYMVMSDSPFEIRDQVRWRDTINLLPRIAVKAGSPSQELEDVETFADYYRQVVDGELAAMPAQQSYLNGASRWAERYGMRLADDQFGSVSYLVIEMLLRARLDRFPTFTN